MITAGGRSSRFGADKLRQQFDGIPLLRRVADSLQDCPQRLLVAPDERYRALLDWPRQADLIPNCGPIGGLYTALETVTTPWLAFAAGDMPHLVVDYWRLLASWRVPCRGAVVAENADGQLEPLAALYHRSALPYLEAQLEHDQFAMQALLEALPLVRVRWAVLERLGQGIFWNVNYAYQLGAQRSR